MEELWQSGQLGRVYEREVVKEDGAQAQRGSIVNLGLRVREGPGFLRAVHSVFHLQSALSKNAKSGADLSVICLDGYSLDSLEGFHLLSSGITTFHPRIWTCLNRRNKENLDI